MALPPSTSSPSHDIPPSTSDKTTPESNPQPVQQDDAPDDEEMVDASDCERDEFLNIVMETDAGDLLTKYNKYQRDYVRRIKAKYLSKKALNGDNIFDEETKVENEIIKSSRWHCTRSFIDTVETPQEESGSPASAAETSADLPVRKTPSKKSS